VTPLASGCFDVYAQQHFWVEFWDFWRLQARERTPRSAALYALMFRRVAATDHQQQAA